MIDRINHKLRFLLYGDHRKFTMLDVFMAWNLVYFTYSVLVLSVVVALAELITVWNNYGPKGMFLVWIILGALWSMFWMLLHWWRRRQGSL